VQHNIDGKISNLIKGFDRLDYVLSHELATALFLFQKLEKPILLEGNPGTGKTAIASVLAQLKDTQLIRLQCYEGLDVNTAVYEWNYQKQLLHIKLFEQKPQDPQFSDKIFSLEYLLKRPLLKAITAKKKVVLLIDEIDRADEEFEAYLLEVLSEYQISIPELGTIKAIQKPLVILTSNQTRQLSDALKRRCLYHWVEFPSKEKELSILKKHLPTMEDDLAQQVVTIIQNLREANLQKAPGIAETVDWAKTLMVLCKNTLDESLIRSTSGSFLKNNEDINYFLSRPLEEFLMPIKNE